MTREDWLMTMIEHLRPEFEAIAAPLPEKIRASCSWPSKSALANRRRRLGECWSAECSEGGIYEVFISPALRDSVEVAAVLVHELTHTAVGVEAGHRGPFRKVALAIGLEGPMVSTVAGEQLKDRLKELVAEVGDYPHAKLDKSNAPKKQTCRQLKVICEECGCICRMSRKAIDDVGCPTCACGGQMVEEGGEDQTDEETNDV